LVASFNTQKHRQIPETFGTGCIEQGVDRPEVVEPAVRLLQKMQFSGIAEVEFKWDAAAEQFKLIEINPRPWDQHRLGNACGVDLIHLAYCEKAGLPTPAITKRPAGTKWIAEDAFCVAALTAFVKRDPNFRILLRQAKGKRIYGIWSASDPLPFLVYFLTRFLPSLAGRGLAALWSALKRKLSYRPDGEDQRPVWQNQGKGKGHV